MSDLTVETSNFTPYPEVNTVLNALLLQVQAILKQQFIGLYLYRSLATGDFNLKTSDIDFLVVTSENIPTKIVPKLETMHMQLISKFKWAIKLEGAYIPKHAIRYFGYDALPRPNINEGNFYLATEGNDWIIQRHIIREQGVVLAGPSPKILIDPVEPEAIRGAVLAYFNEWWLPMLNKPDERLHSSEYQAYAIVSMCRVLYTLHHCTVASKPISARWVQNKFGEDWAKLIEEGLKWQPNIEIYRLNEVMDLIRFVDSSSKTSI